MDIVPIVFAIDENVIIPCGVTITSLLLNAKPETHYDINILYSHSSLTDAGRHLITTCFESWPSCNVSFIDVGSMYESAALNSNGHITKATYYRLQIPDLFPQYDKVIYSDVDIVFQQDLSSMFYSAINGDELIAAVLDLSIDGKFYFNSSLPSSIGKSPRDYFNAGFLVLNTLQMRKEKIVQKFDDILASGSHAENDQDILNIACAGRTVLLPNKYNFQPNHFSNYMWGRDHPEIDFSELFKSATIHYTGAAKPWNSYECVSSDVWWSYYKKSPFYSDDFYFKQQQGLIITCRNEFHKVSSKRLIINLLSRIKASFLRKSS